jgi:RNA polymerase sigma-70 factor (ECF subfamily)
MPPNETVHTADELARACEQLRPRLERHLARKVGPGDAADLTQRVFLKANAAWSSFRGDASLTTWLYRIAANVARDHWRSQQRARAAGLHPSEVSADALEAVPGAAVERPDHESIRREMRSCIREKVEQLPASYREVLELSELHELSDAEVATHLALGLEATKMRLHRARARLRETLRCECSFYRDDANALMCDRNDAG